MASPLIPFVFLPPPPSVIPDESATESEKNANPVEIDDQKNLTTGNGPLPVTTKSSVCLLKKIDPQEFETPLALEQPRSATSFEELLNSGLKPTVIKYNRQPKFKLRYASDYTHSFSLMGTLTLTELTNILVSHQSLRFACFHNGLAPDVSRSSFHDRICLPHLKKITLQIPEEYQKTAFKKKNAIPEEFIRLLHVLKEIHFEQLECLRLVCEPLTAIRFPFAAIFVPTYDMEDNSNPLIHLIKNNKDTLQTIVVGPNMSEMVIKINPKLCDKVCEPLFYPKMESFTSFLTYPTLPSLSAMLRPQKHLTTLNVTLSHEEVWNDVCKAIKASYDCLKSFSLNLLPIDGECVIADLKTLHGCINLTELTIQFKGCNVIGWGYLPRSITTFNFLGGPLAKLNVEAMKNALFDLSEVNVQLSPKIEILVEKSLQEFEVIKAASHPYEEIIKEATCPEKEIFNIVDHPIFQFVTDPPKNLKSFNVEVDPGMELDWEAVKLALEAQDEFKLNEREDGDLSLDRKGPVVGVGETPPEKVEEKEEEQGYFIFPCFPNLTVLQNKSDGLGTENK